MSRSSRFQDDRGSSHRLLRVGENIRHALSEILGRGDLRDPDLEGVSVTVTEVRCSPDLRNATIFVMPLGGVHEKDVEKALNRCAKYIRGQLSHQVSMKYLPKLTFTLDATFGEADHIDQLLHSPHVAQDLGPESEDDSQENEEG